MIFHPAFYIKAEAMVNVLFLDKEGGYGGSSRSLYFLIKNLDRSRVMPFVIIREEGPAVEGYKQLGVKTILKKKMPVYKPSLRKNLYVLFLFFFQVHRFIESYNFLCRTIEDYKIDIVHLNHDGFFVYGLLLRLFRKTKIITHMRTMIPINGFGRFQARCIAGISDSLIFISENELGRFNHLLGHFFGKHLVVHNVAEAAGDMEKIVVRESKEDNIFKILYLGNLTYSKGADRLIDVAGKLKKDKATDVRFVICGEDRQVKKSRQKSPLAAMAEANGVAEFFRFMGHQRRPEEFLLDSDVLIRPSRGNDPWGRDIIEAMTAGKPVLATGIYDKFIENGINGYLFREFEEEAVAQKIIYLKTNPDVIEGMKQANMHKSRLLFDGRTNAGKITALYDSLLEN